MKRFFDKVEKTDYCWIWTGGGRGQGYGALKFKGKIVDAHRVSYELHYGEIPKGMFVCHTCDNRKCVNPDHLFLGTQKDNMRDCKNKGRLVISKKSRFKTGHYPENTRVLLETAIKIKESVINRSDKTLKQLSIDFDVPYQYVRDISAGRILKNR